MDLIKYGSTVTVTKYVNFEPVKETTTHTERYPVEDAKDVLTEFLKLHKRYKDEDLHEISLKLIEKDGNPQFVDLTYSK